MGAAGRHHPAAPVYGNPQRETKNPRWSEIDGNTLRLIDSKTGARTVNLSEDAREERQALGGSPTRLARVTTPWQGGIPPMPELTLIFRWNEWRFRNTAAGLGAKHAKASICTALHDDPEGSLRECGAVFSRASRNAVFERTFAGAPIAAAAICSTLRIR